MVPFRSCEHVRVRHSSAAAVMCAWLFISVLMLSSCTVDANPSARTGGLDASATTPRTVSLNRAVGFGLLRVMNLGERPGPREIVIYNALPNEMPRVAGVITTVMQTPLSHVNLRAVQDDVPNAVITDALRNETFSGLIGQYVRFEVTQNGYTLVAATQTEVETHHQQSRPQTQQFPERDLSVTAITPLDDVTFNDWPVFGVKSANVATLRSFKMPEVVVPNGFAVPFFFYDRFMQENGLYDVARTMMDNPLFTADPDFQEAQLEALRTMVKQASMPRDLSRALRDVRTKFGVNEPVRCRSSTNNEDLPGFSGAGLYDSKTQHPNEGPLDKCVKQVFASVWNLRAYLEREYYRIDHFSTAMGVLLIPSTEREQANGVAVSVDPVYNEPDAYYVNAQLGENLVTNPGALVIPEELLLYGEGTQDVISRSNLVTKGQSVLSAEIVAKLRTSLATIHRRFAALYAVPTNENFAMEIEFKVTQNGTLLIKQARTWQFR